jgi:hypothetical protein
MKIIFDSYENFEKINVLPYIKNKKLAKYFNKESSAAIVSVAKLFSEMNIDVSMPIYYATGLLEYEDYGLCNIVEDSIDDNFQYSQKLFIEKGLTNVSPLNQFKILQNMPLSFISLEYGFNGDNAVVYGSAKGLINYALNAPTTRSILIGAGKVYKNGAIESGFAIINKSDLYDLPFKNTDCEGIEILRYFYSGGKKL